MAMDRFAIPYHHIMFMKMFGNEGLIRVRSAYGLARAYSKWQGFPQGGRQSPKQWTIFDDPLCTAMNADASCEEGGAATVRVHFAEGVSVTGKSFADDKRFLACNAEGMQRRFDMSALWNKMNAILTNVKKSSVQAQVPAGGGRYVPKAALPDITMENGATGTRDVITMFEPDEPLKSLGMLTTAALSDGYAVDAAKATADRVGVCVAI